MTPAVKRRMRGSIPLRVKIYAASLLSLVRSVMFEVQLGFTFRPEASHKIRS